MESVHNQEYQQTQHTQPQRQSYNTFKSSLRKEWKWSKPESGKMERSKRRVKGESNLNYATKIDPQELEELHAKKEEELFSKYTRSDKIDTYQTPFQNGREWVSQVNTNPFLRGNNYLNDLKNEDIFLRPRNTNIDENYLKTKEE